ncbi:trypsin-like peptidase domain-containing protein [Rhodopirellula sp. JC740]|uniref:Trypsin-like peptidase domain-containing protein n=1 Tax=Rhodopirellula halodulae TaxID=2894198 RepID=A0ABS8NFA6_9BACT|nr:trypsin-like peptidase domain-containing protein [Rhodopirellula sp. JC740]MCC9642203.1 trypsin-like peptidase domain-containing protein [Rhodopirellula sp. JC740]
MHRKKPSEEPMSLDGITPIPMPSPFQPEGSTPAKQSETQPSQEMPPKEESLPDELPVAPGSLRHRLEMGHATLPTCEPPPMAGQSVASDSGERDQSNEYAEPLPSDEEVDVSFSRERTGRSPQPHPVLQSLTLLATMGLMLLLARYTVPHIVEEIRYGWHRGELRAEYEIGNEGLRNVSLDSLSRAYQMVTSAVGPTVVHIDVERSVSEEDRSLQRLLGEDAYTLSDQGSGVVIDEDGYILTNRHVIADGVAISVTLSDGRRLPAALVGSDMPTDLAVLKVDADGLIPIQWGDSDELRVGSPVWAVGSPFGLDRTITFGILSGKHRVVRAGVQHGSSSRYQDFMQSDVAVNPGNSGGPLVDARGHLVGINTAIVGDTYQGVSFSIPSNVTRQIYERLRETGRVERGWLGVLLSEVPDSMHRGDDLRVRGALVSGVTGDNSPAAIAGLEVGDIVLKIDDVRVSDVGHLMRLIANLGEGTLLKIDALRDGDPMTFDVRLSRRPENLDR